MENASVKRTKSKFIIILVALLLVFILPFASVAVIALEIAPVYDDTFVGELGEKYERLNSIEGEKIVVVGGSSVAFGLNSAVLEREIGMPVVNFGLYANLGTKLMLDLSKSGIGEGDIIVLAPEMNDQTLSLYFNSETTLQALDGNFGMLKSIDSENYESLVGAAWGFAADKLVYTVNGNAPENSGAYMKKWFDEYGDNIYDRPYNEMSVTPKNITLDYKYDSEDGTVSEYEEFIDYVNEYVKFCTDRGATVYFSFPPMNEIALTDYNTEENISAFYDNLVSSLHCKIISNINDYIMDEGYFFDSEFHLNNAGVNIRTVYLANDLKRELGMTNKTNLELPDPPGYRPSDFVGDDDSGEVGDDGGDIGGGDVGGDAGDDGGDDGGDTEEKDTNPYFELEAGVNGAGQNVWYIVGLKDEGKRQTDLVIPNNIDGVPIVGIKEGAFAGSSLCTLTVGENIRFIASRAFADAEELVAVYIKTLDPSKITIPNGFDENGLATDGGNSALKIYVPKEAFFDYVADYFWGDYSLGEYTPE